jgi:hypothetical protein
LPLVHPDWHAIIITASAGQLWAVAGNDGGVFASTNVFDTPPGQLASIVWNERNAGLPTHLLYSVASGDPTRGNGQVVFSGTQDNATLLADSATSGNFFWLFGGDGGGTAVNRGTAGQFLWAVTDKPFIRGMCQGDANTCSHGANWHSHNPQIPTGDTEPTTQEIHCAAVLTDPSGGAFLTASAFNVWRSDETGTWASITGTHCAAPNACTTGNFEHEIAAVVASPTISGLFGLAFADGSFAVTSDGNAPSPRWTLSTPPLPPPPDAARPNVLALGLGDAFATASTLAFPPVTPPGASPGDVYIAGSDAQTTASGTPVPEATGHLFKTQNRGVTWTPMHGDGGGSDLPNVGVTVVRYDPGDASGSTVYVGTEIGVYRSTDGGSTWQRYGAGLPHVRVTDLYVSLDSTLVRISTFGRGLWEVHPLPRH